MARSSFCKSTIPRTRSKGADIVAPGVVMSRNLCDVHVAVDTTIHTLKGELILGLFVKVNRAFDTPRTILQSLCIEDEHCGRAASTSAFRKMP